MCVTEVSHKEKRVSRTAADIFNCLDENGKRKRQANGKWFAWECMDMRVLRQPLFLQLCGHDWGERNLTVFLGTVLRSPDQTY